MLLGFFDDVLPRQRVAANHREYGQRVVRVDKAALSISLAFINDPTRVPTENLESGMVKLTPDYVAGMMTGAGLAMFFLALGVQSDLLKQDILINSGIMFAGLALVLGGGAMKMRGQSRQAASMNDE